jgi:serine/threonine protein kinase
VDAGRRIGKYVLDERIAVGGMAEVWAAHAEGREGFVKPVALKFILESFSGDPELERLFVNEARIAARLQHANLVAVFDFDQVQPGAGRGAGRYYIAMERIDGYDLRRIAEAARAAGYVFPVPMVLYLAGEICKALRYVHEKREGGQPLGLVHRDVSPHNVLVGATGEVKLSDFGIAKAREHSARSTKPGSLRGKLAYAAPEQLNGHGIDHRADQFAAGVTLWELLAGRRLFDGESDLEILGRVARCQIPTLAEAGGRRDVPAAVEAALRRMLALDPAARFPTTADALSAVLALPGYTPDGAPLGELVRTLFRSAAPEIAHTLPIQAAPAAARRSEAPTRTMHEAVTPLDSSISATADVRSGPRAARVVAAVGLVAGVAVAAAGLTRDWWQAPAAAVAPAVPVIAAPVVAAPVVAAPAPPAAVPAAPAPLPPAESSPAIARVVPSPVTTNAPRAQPASEPRRHRPRAARASARPASSVRRPPAPAQAVPAVAAPAPPAGEPAVRRSANGAPIIE